MCTYNICRRRQGSFALIDPLKICYLMKVVWGRCTVQVQLISAARGWNESQRRIVRSRLAKWAMVKWPGLHMKFWDSYGCIAWHCFQRLYKLSNVNQGLITPPPRPYKRRSRRSGIVSIDLKWPIPSNKETSNLWGQLDNYSLHSPSRRVIFANFKMGDSNWGGIVAYYLEDQIAPIQKNDLLTSSDLHLENLPLFRRNKNIGNVNTPFVCFACYASYW